MTGLLEGSAELSVHLFERTSNAVSNRTRLASRSTTMHIGGDVDLVLHLNGEKRSVGSLGEIFVSEVYFEVTLVGGELAGAGSDAHPSGRGLATARSGENGGSFSSHT